MDNNLTIEKKDDFTGTVTETPVVAPIVNIYSIDQLDAMCTALQHQIDGFNALITKYQTIKTSLVKDGVKSHAEVAQEALAAQQAKTAQHALSGNNQN